MNNLTRTLLAGWLTLSTPLLPLRAQEPAAGDPFLKTPDGTTPAQTRKNAGPWRNCMFVLEVYALDKNDAFTVLDAERGNAARYRRVLELSKSGKAQLETLTALATKSGQRAVSESVDEVRYGAGFVAWGGKDGMASPTTWETRNAGDTFEFEPVLSADGRICDLNVVPQHVSLVAFRDFAAAKGSAPVSQPIFQTQKLTTSTTLTVGEAHFLGTLTPPPVADIADDAASEVWLSFVTVHLQGPTAEELKPPTKAAAWSALQLEYSCFSLERAAAREVLLSAADLQMPWEKLQALLKEKKARLEHVTSIKTKSGQRAMAEEVQEVSYATSYSPGTGDGKGAPTPGLATTFATKSTGVTVEVEPIVLPDGLTIDLNNAVQNTIDFGNLFADGIAAGYVPQPVFETRKITTSQTVLAGRHQLIGTLNPPGADGVNDRPDSGRTWLLFVRVTPNEP